ncbi:MAG: PilN domain-containing protein, partial [Chloroflexi bacterium]|nr:PilN domain-containing protein [Chloroflexota bacterium]
GAAYRKNAAISDIKGQLQVLQPALNQVKVVQTQTSQLEPKLKLLGTAKDSTLHWYLVYQQIGQALPATSWLDDLSVAKGPTGEKIMLTGQSLSQDTVADTIERLQSYPAFTAATLNSITEPGLAEQRKPGYHTVHFDLAVQLKGAQEAPNGQTPPKN